MPLYWLLHQSSSPSSCTDWSTHQTMTHQEEEHSLDTLITAYLPFIRWISSVMNQEQNPKILMIIYHTTTQSAGTRFSLIAIIVSFKFSFLILTGATLQSCLPFSLTNCFRYVLTLPMVDCFSSSRMWGNGCFSPTSSPYQSIYSHLTSKYFFR